MSKLIAGSGMKNPVAIEYCVPCGFEKQAAQLTEEIEDHFSDQISQVILKPVQSIGSFEVFLGEELVFSKMNTGNLPRPGEIRQLIMMRLY